MPHILQKCGLNQSSREDFPCPMRAPLFFFGVRHLRIFFFYKISYTLCPRVNVSL